VVLNQEQQLLKDTIAGFLDEHAPVAAMRKLRDEDGPGYDPGLWQQMVALGIPATVLPEAYDGLGFGWLGLGAILEETGRRLSASPLVSSVAAASSLILAAGNEPQKARWLKAIAAGEIVFSVAINESHHFDSSTIKTVLSNKLLTGRKTLVADAQQADYLLVVCDSGVSAVVATQADGVSIEQRKLMDGRQFATVTFNNVSVADEDCFATDSQAIDYVVDIGALAIAAEMIGGARELLERTVLFLNEREQFDVKIGTFQALQHRCAQMYCELELAASAVLQAFSRLDYGVTDISAMASTAKALSNDCYQLISNEAVQMHGGMGVTDELDIGLFLKRSRVCNQLYGDAAWHRNRYARLKNL
tara:strand:- start:1622 stop:2704 length:1083 start_codon:yes stop_codon:yes gene_type:complete